MLRERSFIQSAPLPPKSYIHISAWLLAGWLAKAEGGGTGCQTMWTCSVGEGLPHKKDFLKSSAGINVGSESVISDFISNRWLFLSGGSIILCMWRFFQRHWGENKNKTLTNSLPAFGLSGFLSGWHSRAFCRYAFLICNKYKGMQLVMQVKNKRKESHNLRCHPVLTHFFPPSILYIERKNIKGPDPSAGLSAAKQSLNSGLHRFHTAWLAYWWDLFLKILQEYERGCNQLEYKKTIFQTCLLLKGEKSAIYYFCLIF